MREGLVYHGNHLCSLSRATIEPLPHWLVSEKTGHRFATASSHAEGAVKLSFQLRNTQAAASLYQAAGVAIGGHFDP